MVLLVLLVLLIALPIWMVMPNEEPCPACDLFGPVGGMCLAILVLASLFVPTLTTGLTMPALRRRQLLIVLSIERPPRTA